MEFIRKHRNDIALILAALAAAGAAWVFMLLTRQEGGVAVVSVDGEEIASYPLDRDAEELIESGRGENILVISDGAARVTKADCPDGVCVRTGEIRYDGETIVCLPHRLVVEIRGGGSSGIDAAAD